MAESDSPTEFKLRGTIYRCTKQGVERQLANVEPRPTEKYSVMVCGRAFPPKQVVAEALDIPVISFTTMDASRILTKLGFEVGPITENGRLPNMNLLSRNSGIAIDRELWTSRFLDECRRPDLGEVLRQRLVEEKAKRLFESYLFTSGMPNVARSEPQQGGSIPDIVVALGDRRLLFEVKNVFGDVDEYDQDPCRPIRDKIIAAETELQSADGKSRCLVLYSQRRAFPVLNWQFIYWSMLRTSKIAVQGMPSPGSARRFVSA